MKALQFVWERVIVAMGILIVDFCVDTLKNQQGGILFLVLFTLVMYIIGNMAMVKVMYSYLAIAGAIALVLKVGFPYSRMFAIPEVRKVNRRRVVR